MPSRPRGSRRGTSPALLRWPAMADTEVKSPAMQASESTPVRGRLAPPMPSDGLWGWAGPLLVTAFAAFLRFDRLSVPRGIVFDEHYYVPDAFGILNYGVEPARLRRRAAAGTRRPGICHEPHRAARHLHDVLDPCRVRLPGDRPRPCSRQARGQHERTHRWPGTRSRSALVASPRRSLLRP